MTDNSKTTPPDMAAFFGDALETAILHYQEFVKENAEGKKTPAEFKAFHEGCKSGIAHIMLLIKGLEHFGITPDTVDSPDLAVLIENAQAEIDAYEARKKKGE